MDDENLTDNEAIDKVVDMLKEKGIFDQIRKNCLEDINTKSSFLNLNQKIEGYVDNFLRDQRWDTTLSKNQLRERLRKNINESVSIKNGITHLSEQVINPIGFENKIEEQIRELLGIEEEEVKVEPIKKEEANNEFDELSEDDKLVSDVSSDDEGLFEGKASDELSRNKVNSEAIDTFEKNLDSFLNDKRNTEIDKNESNIKNEKYESSISSTEEFDMD